MYVNKVKFTRLNVSLPYLNIFLINYNSKDKDMNTTISHFGWLPRGKLMFMKEERDSIPGMSNFAFKLVQIGPKWYKYGTF